MFKIPTNNSLKKILLAQIPVQAYLFNDRHIFMFILIFLLIILCLIGYSLKKSQPMS